MEPTDPGPRLVAAVAAAFLAAAAACLFAGLAGAAAALLIVPVVPAAYRERRWGTLLVPVSAVAFAVFSLASGAGAPAAALGGAAVGGSGLLVAAALGTAAGEAATFRLWYHGLRDRLPTATLFFMPATGRIHDLNERAGALLGPVMARSLADSFEDPGAYRAFASGVAAGEVVRSGAWLRAADGSRRWCEVSGAMATPVLAVVSVDDRTAAREAGDALAASEEAHRALVEHLPGGALLVDEDLRVRAAGGAALSLVVATGAPLAGRTLWSALPGRIAQAVEPLARLATFGVAGTGEVAAEGRRLALTAVPVPGDGSAGALVALEDVTGWAERVAETEDRRAVAEALASLPPWEVEKAASGPSPDLAGAAPVPLVLAGRDGLVRHENPAARAFFGDPAPPDLFLRLAGADRNRARTALERGRYADGGAPFRLRLRVPGLEGGERACLALAAFRRDEDATVLAFLDLSPVAAFDACRDRALRALEARFAGPLEGDTEDAESLVEAIDAAWRASIRERAVLGAPTPFGDEPSGCDGYA